MNEIKEAALNERPEAILKNDLNTWADVNKALEKRRKRVSKLKKAIVSQYGHLLT